MADKNNSTPAAGEGMRRPAPRWKLALIFVAAAMVIVGLALMLFGGGATPAPRAELNAPGASASTLVEGTGGNGGETPSGAAAWAPGLLRVGLSFFVGFAIGAAFRTFFKVSMIFVGVLALALIGLSQFDLVTVHWDRMETLWSGFTARVGRDFATLQTMITGSLPQAGLGAMGLFAGLKR